MTTYYKRAGAGNWSAAGSWSLSSGGPADGSVPTSSDDVVLDASSGNLTIDGTSGSPSICRDITCTGYTGTLSQSATHLHVYGSMLLVSGMVYTPSSTATTRFRATSSKNITSGGKNQAGTVYFDGVGGSWTFLDNFQQPANSASNVQHERGTIVINGKTWTIIGYNGSNSNTRGIDGSVASSAIVHGATSTGGTFDITNSTNFTLDSSNLSVSWPCTTANVIFIGGGLTWNTGSATARTTGSVTVSSSAWTNLTLKHGASSLGAHLIGSGVTVTGTFDSTGTNGTTQRNWIKSDTAGVQRTLTVNTTVTAPNCDWQDIIGAGTASWNLSAVSGNSGDCGNNSGITFTAPVTQYWVPASGTSTGSISASTRWATSSGGTAGTGRTPLPQDTLIFDANSIDAGGRTITFDMSRVGTYDWTGATNSPTMSLGSATRWSFGSITLISAMTISNANAAQNHSARSNFSITTAGKVLNTSIGVIFDCAGATCTLNDDYTASVSITFASGTVSSGSYGFTGHTLLNVSGGTVDVYKVLGSSTASLNSGSLTVGAGGISSTGLTNSGCAFVLNGVSTITGAFLSAGGTTEVNADFTVASISAPTGGTITGNDASIIATSNSARIDFPASTGTGDPIPGWVAHGG